MCWIGGIILPSINYKIINVLDRRNYPPFYKLKIINVLIRRNFAPLRVPSIIKFLYKKQDKKSSHPKKDESICFHLTTRFTYSVRETFIHYPFNGGHRLSLLELIC